MAEMGHQLVWMG